MTSEHPSKRAKTEHTNGPMDDGMFPTTRAAPVEVIQNASTVHVELRSAAEYTILTKAGITNVPPSSIRGHMAVSPITGASITGFDLQVDETSTFAHSNQVTGKVYGANYEVPTPATLTQAVGDMQTAYTEAAGRLNPTPERINIGGGALGGAVGGESSPLTPGVYTFASNVTIQSDLYLRGVVAQGQSDIFILQVTGNLWQAAKTRVLLTNGAQAQNVFWQVAGNVQVMAGAHLEGIVLCKTDVTFLTDSSLTGRVLAQTACVLQQTTITPPGIVQEAIDSEAEEEPSDLGGGLDRGIGDPVAADDY